MYMRRLYILREVVWLMLLHDISSNCLDDYDDGLTQTSKIRFLALARNQLLNIQCKATNSHGSVEQEHSNLSYLNTVAPVCIISSKLRVGINTPFISCG